jgi:hypothetical protein
MLSITVNITWRTIMGALFIGAAVAFSSLGIGRAEHFTPDKKITVYKCSTGTACLRGNSSGSKTWGIYAEGTSDDALHAISSSGSGVYGMSSTANGVYGVTSTTIGNSAVAGISKGSTGSGHGVYGRSSNGDGVFGTSTTANGVYGATTEGTTTGSIPNAAGVFGTSSGYDGAGVEGTGSSGVIGLSSGSAGTAVVAFAKSATGDIFFGANSANIAESVIDPNANLQCSGKISGEGPMLARQRSDAGRRVLTYAAQAATPTIEDLGAAQMRDGVANVKIPGDFASVIDHSNPYYVFLTPMSDTRGLYVSMENAAGFQVRENMHGRSNVTFQYRIIGVPLGAKNVRLPTAPEMKVPPLLTLAPSVR